MFELMSRQESADYLRISVRTLDRRIREGKIPYSADLQGARVLIRKKDLDAYIKQTTRHC